MDEQLKLSALAYHQFPKPGKISVTPTKPLSNQLDLSLAYSPGVAAACMAIFDDPLDAQKYTARGNLVGVVTNGTAVLGLGNIGPLAAKPVMEGKGCLFKKFAGIDVFDIELAETDPDKLVDAIAMLEPTLGGINLEDIKAPECFYIEKKLRERMKIPVFHDDQHGTAIIASAAILNGLKVVGKKLDEVKLVCSGAGAAAIACLDLLVHLGLNKSNILVCDSKGVIYEGRGNLDPSKERYAANTTDRTLADAIHNADVFLGCSSAGVLKPEMVKVMGTQPLILALANPEPEIRPEEAKKVRPDAIIATGRSDYPNQVNNVLCFPFIFRGALDVGATTITEEMKLACVRAIAELAEETDQGDEVAKAYEGHSLEFGPDYLIPKPFDPRLIIKIAPAVAQAAMDSGVATRPDGLSHGDGDAAGVCCGEISAGAHRVRRGRRRARTARRAIRAAGEDREADHHRTAGGGGNAADEDGLEAQAGDGFRDRESGRRSALPEMLAGISQHRCTRRRDAGQREGRAAQVQYVDWRDPGASGRCRRHDLRHDRHVSRPSQIH